LEEIPQRERERERAKKQTIIHRLRKSSEILRSGGIESELDSFIADQENYEKKNQKRMKRGFQWTSC